MSLTSRIGTTALVALFGTASAVLAQPSAYSRGPVALPVVSWALVVLLATALVVSLSLRPSRPVEQTSGVAHNAAMQIVMNPRQFDVLLTGNMFGDILSDLTSTLVGSLGMLPSACLGGTVGLFEPVHGSAPDIAGMDKANPIGAIVSSAMLFEELNQPELAIRIRRAVEQALLDGYRTADMLAEDSTEVGTKEMTNVIANRLSEVAA